MNLLKINNFFILLFAITSLHSLAQNVPSDTLEGKELNEVVVTTTRSPISKEVTPQNIDLITAKDLKLTNSVEFTDIIKNNSSVNVVQYPGLLGGVSIRGYRPQTGGLNQRVLLLVDGRPAGTSSISTINPGNIERIEVLKGPGSALYGAQAMGGVINIITKKSTGKIKSSITTEYGSYQTIRFGAATGGNITKSLDFDLSLNFFDRSKNFKLGEGNVFRNLLNGEQAEKKYFDGSTKNEDDRRSDGMRRTYTRLGYNTGNLRLGYQLTNNWRIDVRGERFSAKNVESPSDIAFGNTQPSAKDIERNNGELLVSGIVGRNQISAKGYTSNEVIGNQTLTDYTGAPVAAYLSYKSKAQWTGLQLKDIIKVASHSIIVGFDYNNSSTSSNVYNSDNTEGRPYSPNYSLTTAGLYAQGFLSFLESKLTVNPGIRFDNISYNVKKTHLLESYKSGKESNPFVSPSVGVQYEIVHALRAHGSLGRGYVTPDAYNVAGYSVSKSSKGAAVTMGNPDLKNENSWTWDAGVRFNNSRSGLSLDLTYFQTKVKDRITTQTTVPTTVQKTSEGDTIKSLTTYINANEGKIKGLEMELAYDLGALRNYAYSLRLFVNATRNFTAKEITVKRDGTKSEKYIYNVPVFTANYGFDYDSHKGLIIRLNARYVGNRKDTDFNDPAYPEIKYPAFMVADFAANYTFQQKHTVGLLINNITDENYYEKRGFNMPGRNFSLRYSISF
jgi:vitamin B12 transporter